MRSGNPTLSDTAFATQGTYDGEAMTIEGTVNKTLLCLLLLLATASYAWINAEELMGKPYILIGAVVLGLIVGLVTVFVKKYAAITAPLYAAIEGVVIGLVSVLFETLFPGIVLQAVGLTFGVLFIMLLLYRSQIIKVTENFKLAIVSATGAVMLVYLVGFIGSFFGWQIPLIHGNGIVGILFSLVVVGIAAMNLVLDFDFIEKAAETGRSPKYLEWYGAFGLIVTLVWLYLEILRLLAKLRSR